MTGLIVLGFFTAVLAGMGLGGGVLLIPVLLSFYSTDQLQAQIVSLITYIPMAAVALIINFKKQNIRIRSVGRMLPFGIAGAVSGALTASLIDRTVLRRAYGIFLLFFGLYQLYSCLKIRTKE